MRLLAQYSKVKYSQLLTRLSIYQQSVWGKNLPLALNAAGIAAAANFAEVKGKGGNHPIRDDRQTKERASELQDSAANLPRNYMNLLNFVLH